MFRTVPVHMMFNRDLCIQYTIGYRANEFNYIHGLLNLQLCIRYDVKTQEDIERTAFY